MKTNTKQTSQNSVPTFADYVKAVGRYSPQGLVSKYQSELLAMFRCGVKPIGAAVHIYCIHNR